MNKIIVFLCLFSFIYAADTNATSDNTNAINKQIQSMKETRKIDSSILQDIADPFYYDKAIGGVPSNVFTRTSNISNTKNSGLDKIQAIVGHKVKIADKWYSINNKVNDNQKITNILKDSIILENDSGEQSIEIVKKEYNNEIYVK